MKLAYCIPTYNSFDRCVQAIHAVMKSTRLPDALIIIDDSGVGAALEKIVPILTEYYTNGYKNIFVWVHDRQCGVATSWNQFFHDAPEYDHFVLANDDVIIHPETIERLLAAADEQPDEVFFAGDGYSGNTFSFFLLRRAGFDKVGTFDERFFPAYFEDNDYSRRLTLAGYKHIIVDGATYDHVGSSTLKNYTPSEQQQHHHQFRKNEEFFKYKWGGKPGQEIYHIPFNGVHE